MFKQVNENNSQFHFPLINKFFYQDEKGKIDMIDRIKFSLKQEYSEKLKEKKMNKRTRNKVNEKNNNHKHYYINSTAREILSELNEKEKRLTKSTFKLNKSLIYFKNTNENFHTKKANKTQSRFTMHCR